MKLTHHLHLAYCTNIHRGETWPQIFDALKQHTLAVRDRVAKDRPYAIGLRLSDEASRELEDPAVIAAFCEWLDRENCYVFTINGFPYGQFHGTRVKEQVYAPDWTTRERLEYTQRLFNILAQLLPEGVEGSVSTVPVSYKEFIWNEDQVRAARANLWKCVDHIAALSAKSGRKLHLGLEPEPLCYIETTQETVYFFKQLREDRPGDSRLDEFLGVNYDCCHLAVEFESPAEALARLREARIRISKLHLSNALKTRASSAARQSLRSFAEDIYFHQVVERNGGGSITRYRDLDIALAQAEADGEGAKPAKFHTPGAEPEWRIHFHIPLHCHPGRGFDTTADHLLGILDALAADPGICSHLEMETYTWEVMPPEMKNRHVTDQLVDEYRWTLAELKKRGITPLA